MASRVSPIRNLDSIERRLIRQAVHCATRYWPNAHLGTQTTREDIRSAFSRIRAAEPAIGLLPAVYRVEDDAYACMDM